MKIICLLFYFSGIAALTYEVLWVRHLGLIFGNTVYAAATVMMTYMFGLALGSHFSGKWASKIKRPVRFFGILEVATALYALSVPLIFKLIQVLYRYVALNVSDSLAFLTFVRVVLALVLLLIPTAMMGATLPVLSKGFLTRVERFGSRLGILYGVNTLGAVSGVLLSGFIFIPKLGMTVSNVVAVCLDASVGLIAIYLSRTMDKSPEIAEGIEQDAKVEITTFKRGKLANWLLLAIGASGFLSLSFEVVWFRALIQVFGSTTYSFSAMLAVYLIGLSVGAMVISRFVDRIKNPALVFGVAAMLTGIFTLISLGWFTEMPEFLLIAMSKSASNWHVMIGLKFVITLIFLLVPTMLFGASFTLAVKAIRSALNSSPRAVGEAAMFNTLGAALGAFFGGFILLPALGMLNSLSVCAFLTLALGLVLCWFFAQEMKFKGAVLGVAVLTVIGFTAAPPEWDKLVLSSGPHFTPWSHIKDGKVTWTDELRSQRLLYYNEGLTATTSVILDASEFLFYSSHGKVEADTTDRGMVIQRMMAHLPMLFHPNPQRVMNLGLGAGVTFGSVACYPAEHMEVVEIEPSAGDVARVWGEWNDHVMDNPNIKVTINDGRNHLFVGGEPYDVITSDPFEPVVAGAGNLYTVDFFELAKSRLNDGGFMAQFLPLYEMSNEDYQMIMRSFATAFPDCVIFFTGVDTILVGSKRGDWSFSVVEEKFKIPAVAKSLEEIGFTRPEDILSMFVARVDTNDPEFTGSKVNTDNHPIIEFNTPKSKYKYQYTTDLNQQSLLEHYSEIPAEMMQELTEQQKEVALKSHKAMKMTLQANILRSNNNYKENIMMLMQAAELVPENPIVLNELGASLAISAKSVMNNGHTQQAAAQFQLLRKYKPDDFWAIYHLVGLYMQLGDVQNANKALGYGLLKYPESPLFIALRGRFRGTMGDVNAACEDLKSAIQQLPEYILFWEDYEVFLRQKGDLETAREARKKIDYLSK